jgi:outer membrane protein assembly factor BamB
MHKKNLIYLLMLVLAAFALSACSGGSRVAATSWPGVTATAETVYVASGPHVYAVSAADGRLNWQYPQEAEGSLAFFAAPALADDNSRIVAGAYDNSLYLLNADTGALAEWTFSEASNRFIGDPLILNDGIYAPNADGKLYALDLDGAPLWPEHFDSGEPIWAGPAVNGDTIYIAALDLSIHAIDAATGQERWSRELSTATTSTPTYADGVLYVGTFGNRVFAIEVENGQVLWEYETRDWVWASTAYADGVVYAGDVSGYLYALDAESGDPLWNFPADGPIYGGPLALDGTIYFGTVNGDFYALSSEGDLDWSLSLPGKIYGPPTFNGEYIFIATIEGEDLLTAVDLTGTARWRFAPEE